MDGFEVHLYESVRRKSGRLGMEQVTRNIIVSCMSWILVHMSYFYFILIISSYRLRSSEALVFSRYLSIFGSFGTLSSYIQVNNTTYQKVSVISCKY